VLLNLYRRWQPVHLRKVVWRQAPLSTPFLCHSSLFMFFNPHLTLPQAALFICLTTDPGAPCKYTCTLHRCDTSKDTSKDSFYLLLPSILIFRCSSYLAALTLASCSRLLPLLSLLPVLLPLPVLGTPHSSRQRPFRPCQLPDPSGHSAVTNTRAVGQSHQFSAHLIVDKHA
jgi:hypothetical protein